MTCRFNFGLSVITYGLEALRSKVNFKKKKLPEMMTVKLAQKLTRAYDFSEFL